MYMMMTITTLKSNLGEAVILYPRVTCCIIAFPPSSVALTTHQPASSSSNLVHTHTHLPTLVRSYSHPFPESNDQQDQVQDLRVPDHWLVPNTAFQVLLFFLSLQLCFGTRLQYKIEFCF